MWHKGEPVIGCCSLRLLYKGAVYKHSHVVVKQTPEVMTWSWLSKRGWQLGGKTEIRGYWGVKCWLYRKWMGPVGASLWGLNEPFTAWMRYLRMAQAFPIHCPCFRPTWNLVYVCDIKEWAITWDGTLKVDSILFQNHSEQFLTWFQILLSDMSDAGT